MNLVINIISININNYYDKSINLTNKKLDDMKETELKKLSNLSNNTQSNNDKNNINLLFSLISIGSGIYNLFKRDSIIKKYEYIKSNNSDEKILDSYDKETKSKIISMKKQYNEEINIHKANYINFKNELTQTKSFLIKKYIFN